MKKIRIVLLLLIMLLVTGCSGTYNLNIDKNLKVKEELNVTLENEASSYEKLDSLLKSKKVDEKEYKLVTKENDLKVTYKHEYDSIEEYLLESLLYKQLFDNISYNTDRVDYTLEANNIFNLNNTKLDNSKNIKLLQINVTTPLYIIDENSDTNSENTYSWTIDNNTKEKDIFINFSIKDKKLNNGTIIVICSFVLSVLIILIILIKRLLETKKI